MPLKRLNKSTLYGESLHPDVAATLGAKMSRAYDLMAKWDDIVDKSPPEPWDVNDLPPPVKSFVSTNLGSYGHASIAEMAHIFVAVNDIGWPASWLMLDTPLFVGQENSSRVIDQTNLGSQGPCRFAPQQALDLHDEWMELYNSTEGAGVKGAYKFDDRRFVLPGTAKTGVVLAGMTTRAASRHLQRLSGLGGWIKEMTADFKDGIKACAPNVAAALDIDKDRNSSSSFLKNGPGIITVRQDRINAPCEIYDRESHTYLEHLVSIELRDDDGSDELDYISAGADHRNGRGDYLDEAYHHGPDFKLKQMLSVGTARDEHRHRPMMPYKLDVVIDRQTDLLAKIPYCPIEIPDDLWRRTSEAFHDIYRSGDRWGALYALPFCAMLNMTSVSKLPDIVYKLELRAYAKGAHWEYRDQNMALLEQLREILSDEFIELEQI